MSLEYSYKYSIQCLVNNNVCGVHPPSSVYVFLLVNTRDVDKTITNILEGRVKFEEEPSTSHVSHFIPYLPIAVVCVCV